MEWINRLREKRADRRNHIVLFERLQKQNERWWISLPAAIFFSLTLLPIKTDTFGTIKLIVSIAGAILYCLTKLLTHLHRAPLTKWRHLSTAAGVIGTVWIVMPACLLLSDGQGNREHMLQLLCCAPFAWLAFGYARLRIRRIRRASAETIERLHREMRRRKRSELS